MKTIIRIIASGFIISLFSGTDAVSETIQLEQHIETHAAAFAVEGKADALQSSQLAERLKNAASTDKFVAMIYKHEAKALEGKNEKKELHNEPAQQSQPIVRQIDTVTKKSEGHHVLELYQELESLFALPK